MKWYRDTFEGLGYKVEYYEYEPFSSSFHKQAFLDTEQKNDAMYTLKHKYPKGDIVLWNMNNNIVIELVSL